MSKLLLVVITSLFLSTSSSEFLTQGQTRKGRAKPRTRITKPIKVVRQTLATTESGLVYVITRQSEGRHPVAGDRVIVNYTGLLTGGVKFDSSLDRGQPLTFTLGIGRVIKGWDEGIAKLRVGEQATLIVPPSIGYGTSGRGAIPPDATLIFIVELLGIEERKP